MAAMASVPTTTNIIGKHAYLKCDKDGCACHGYSKRISEQVDVRCLLCGHSPDDHKKHDMDDQMKDLAKGSCPGQLPTVQTNYWWATYYQALNQQMLMHLWASWSLLDRDFNGHITANELAMMTVPAGATPWAGRMIGVPAAMRLIQLFDVYGTRTVTFYEYAAMHEFFSRMQTAFSSHDIMRTGVLGPVEVCNALRAANIEVTIPVIQAYIAKFGYLGWYGATLDFLGFVMMSCDILLAKTRFQKIDSNKDGKINLEKFLIVCADLTAMSSLLHSVY